MLSFFFSKKGRGFLALPEVLVFTSTDFVLKSPMLNGNWNNQNQFAQKSSCRWPS